MCVTFNLGYIKFPLFGFVFQLVECEESVREQERHGCRVDVRRLCVHVNCRYFYGSQTDNQMRMKHMLTVVVGCFAVCFFSGFCARALLLQHYSKSLFWILNPRPRSTLVICHTFGSQCHSLRWLTRHTAVLNLVNTYHNFLATRNTAIRFNCKTASTEH